MSDSEIAIRVQNLSKRYRIGLEEEKHDTFASTIASYIKRPGVNLQRLRSLSRFSDDGRDDIIWALKDVSFEVKQGEVLGIIGRNGAGKSTLLKILSRITYPTTGRIEMRGRVSSLLEVGTGFHPEMTGRENIYLNGTILGMRKREIDHKFDEIVAFSGVEKFIDTPVKRYSSGMRVRLAFSVAAHLEPEILLIDEVLAVGDANFQKKCLGKMQNVAHAGRTVLFVSHNLFAMQQLCPRGILIENGSILRDSQISDVVSMYMRKAESKTAFAEFNAPEHNGSGEAKIVWARVMDVKGSEKHHFSMGESVSIEFVVETEIPNIPLTHAVEISDSLGVPILHLWDVDNVASNGVVGKRRKITASITNLDLFPDQYFVTLWIGTSAASRVDRLENCLSFEVKQEMEFLRQFSKHRGAVYRTANWAYLEEG